MRENRETKRKEILAKLKKFCREKTKEITFNIFLFGMGFPRGGECLIEDYLSCDKNCELKSSCVQPRRRKKIQYEIEQKLGDFVIFPEEIRFIYPAIDEKVLIKEAEIDLVILLPENPGSIYEFGDFSKDPEIAQKLRIFIPKKYHPLEGDIEQMDQSLLTNAYLIHLADYGHIYSYRSESDLIWKILILIESYRQVKYLNLKNLKAKKN